jgi:hypothetical protein
MKYPPPPMYPTPRPSERGHSIQELPTLPDTLPPHQISYNSDSHRSVGTWYRFVEPAQNQLPASFWLVKRTGRADRWTLLECNQAFIQLIQLSPESLSSNFSVMDLVPTRFKSSTSELLQQIVHSRVPTAAAKSLWKKGNSETCVNSRYRIFQLPRSIKPRSNPKEEPKAAQKESQVIACSAQYPSGESHCETTGCGAFNREWSSVEREEPAKATRTAPTDQSNRCGDEAFISHSEREHDRVVWSQHEEVDSYDDYIQIGNKIHEQTFSIQVSTILSLISNSTSSIIRPKSKP